MLISAVDAGAVVELHARASDTAMTAMVRMPESMLQHLRDVDPNGFGMPRHVERELEAFLRCGLLEHGFTRVRCTSCHDELLVAFSRKCRGICPSCTSRRMEHASWCVTSRCVRNL